MTAQAQIPATEERPFVERMIVIDLGKVKRKRIKALKRGRGKLVDEVADAMNKASSEINSRLGPDAANGLLVPVVLIYRRKGKRRGKGIRLPLLFG